MVFFQIGLVYKWVPLLVISILTFFVQIGPESFPNLISSEIFPNDTRSTSKGVLRALSSILSFLVLSLFPTITAAIGLDLTFLVLALVLLLTLPLTYLYLPEAKDVNLHYVSKFYSPVTTVFYSGSNQEEMENRVQMVENTFGPWDKVLVTKGRRLLVEGRLKVFNHPTTIR